VDPDARNARYWAKTASILTARRLPKQEPIMALPEYWREMTILSPRICSGTWTWIRSTQLFMKITGSPSLLRVLFLMGHQQFLRRMITTMEKNSWPSVDLLQPISSTGQAALKTQIMADDRIPTSIQESLLQQNQSLLPKEGDTFQRLGKSSNMNHWKLNLTIPASTAKRGKSRLV
jgi:hypothetical protein